MDANQLLVLIGVNPVMALTHIQLPASAVTYISRKTHFPRLFQLPQSPDQVSLSVKPLWHENNPQKMIKKPLRLQRVSR